MKYLIYRIIKTLFRPSYAIGPGVFLSQSKYAQWHRNISLNYFSSLAHWQRWLILLLNVICWLMLTFWVLLISHIKACLKDQHTDNKKKNFYLFELVYLGLWFGVSPTNHHVFQLHKTLKTRWWEFIFIEEQLSWYGQNNFATGNNKQNAWSVDLLNSKNKFTELLTKNNLPVIPILGLFSSDSYKNSELFEQHLFKDNKLTSFFLKPINQHAMRGCFEVTQNKSRYSAKGFDINGQAINITGRKNITNKVFECLHTTEQYLLQKTLANHANLTNSKSTSLITFRIITAQTKQSQKLNHQTCFALVELPLGSFNDRWLNLAIDINTGQIISDTNNIINQELFKAFWPTILSVCYNAHKIFPDILSIGWDLCITESGVYIMEGNFGWDAIRCQQLANKPALNILI